MSQDLEYETAVSGGSLTFPVAGGSVRKGSNMMIKGFPCKVTEISVSKTGKHGHAKAHVFGNDIFTGKKYEDVFPTSHSVDSPVVTKGEFEVVSHEEGALSYMTEDGDIEEIPFPTEAEFAAELEKAIEEGKTVIISIMSAMERRAVIAWRETRD